jgi:hypothetical protein
MSNDNIGKLPPRYSFILNQYPGERLSKCPRCHRPTHDRKFPLFILIEGWGPLVLGKTCRYCARCETIIAHQHELEAELGRAFEKIDPDVIGNDYLVVGTMDRKTWEHGLTDPIEGVTTALQHVADFEHVLDLHVDPGGWRPAESQRESAPRRGYATPRGNAGGR